MVAGAIGPGELEPGAAAALGALQGLTEFLPVSSSGHLSLAQAWLGIDPATAGHRFNVAVHAATLLAVVWVYRSDLVGLLRAALRPGVASAERDLLVAVVVGTLPLVAVLAPGVEPLIIAMEGNVRAVGAALLVTALLLVVATRRMRDTEDAGAEPPSIGMGSALVIGLFQLLAVMPGISRSGSTIAAALVLGVAPAPAARFSFLLMIPAVSAAALLEVLDIVGQPGATAATPLPYAIGFATSLVVGLLALRWLLRLVVRGRLMIFVPYLAAVGIAALALGGGID